MISEPFVVGKGVTLMAAVPPNADGSGDVVYLRAVTLEDAADGPWFTWFNDPEATKFTRHGGDRNTREKQVRFFRSLEGDDSRFVFAICESHEDTHVGIVSLQHIDYQERTAHLAIMLGDKAYWGKGAAKQALDLAAQFGFSYLNLIRLFAGTYAANTSMNFTLRSLGMMRTDTVRLLADPEAALYVDGFTWAAVQSEWKPLHALVLGEADGSSD
jgi:RimJ/RimL family protein N-acetyltransferase